MKNCNKKRVLQKKISKLKKVQHEKSAQKVQHENIATRKMVRHEKFMMKTLGYEDNKT